MTIFELVLIFCAGLASGVINVMAGGGSTITLGVMILMGMDAAVANGTNRIGLLVESSSGVMAFRSEKFFEFRESLKLSLFTLPGAILGAIFAIRISNELFQQILAIVMILILISLFIPKNKNKEISPTKEKNKLLIYPAMVFIGFYGGFIQVGIGFILMAALRHLLMLDLVRVNMHKVAIIFVYTIPLIALFGLTGNIDWFVAIFLSLGYAVGAWCSAKISVARGERVIKIILGLAIVIMAGKFLMPFFR